MKKVGLLSLILIVLILGISALTNVTNAQSAKKVKKVIEENNRNLMEWFNNQEVDKLVDLYRDDACLLNRGCGKSFIKTYYQMECRKTGRKWLIVNELAGTSY